MDKILKKTLILLGCLAILSTTAAGCSPVEKTLKLLIGGGENKETEVSLEPIKKSTDQETVKNDPNVLGTEKVQVVLYFADKDGKNLVKELRQIPKVQSIARATLEELLMGPGPESNLVQTIPKGTKLLDINIKPDGLAIVSFSRELKEKHTGGSASEGNTVYAIVNTLTQFPSVRQVQILIDDQAVETLAGHLDISKPLERNPEIIGSK